LSQLKIEILLHCREQYCFTFSFLYLYAYKTCFLVVSLLTLQGSDTSMLTCESNCFVLQLSSPVVGFLYTSDLIANPCFLKMGESWDYCFRSE